MAASMSSGSARLAASPDRGGIMPTVRVFLELGEPDIQPWCSPAPPCLLGR
jgi:hypothetical protein